MGGWAAVDGGITGGVFGKKVLAESKALYSFMALLNPDAKGYWEFCVDVAG